MAKIFVFGCAGHARVAFDVIEKQGIHQIEGIIDSFAARGFETGGLRVLGTELELRVLANERAVRAGIVAIGDNFTRHLMVRKILEASPDFEFISAVHPSAEIGRAVRIGAGTIVMAGAVINPGSTIGEHCIINTNSSVDHDNVFGNFSSIAPGAATGGNVTVGEFSAVSLRAGIIHGCNIGAHTVVGAGATVFRDLPDFVIAYGTPARVIRARQAGERYL